MSLSIVDVAGLDDDPAGSLVSTWSAAGRGADAGDGIVLRHGSQLAVVAPSPIVERWLTERYGAEACLATELASFVYRRKGWFAPGLDPLSLRDVRPGQYEVRVVTEATGALVPLFAMDLAPVRHHGTWATIDQSSPHAAASLLEIAVVPGDQPLVVGGAERRLGALACATGRLWEASRLGSVTELLRLAPGPDEDAHAWFGLVQARADELDGFGPRRRHHVQEVGRGLFGLALGWAFTRLPVDVAVGLSQGQVVRALTATLTGAGEPCHHPLRVERWHTDAAALAYAPGYFATGAVQGYAIDGVLAHERFVRTACRRLHRTRRADSTALMAAATTPARSDPATPDGSSAPIAG